MAPKRTDKTKEVEKVVDYNSPASKRKLTINKRDHKRRGWNKIQAINGYGKGENKTQAEILAADRVAYDKTKPVKFEAFRKAHAEHIRKKNGETGLTQSEWESVSDHEVRRLIAIADPATKEWVGELMKKATPYERNSFNQLVAQTDAELQHAARAWRSAKAHQKEVAIAKAKAEMADAMRPEF